MPKPIVSYYYDKEIACYTYGPYHPMKPFRNVITHNLILHYGLYKYLQIHTPPRISSWEMTQYHAESYIKVLSSFSSNKPVKSTKKLKLFNIVGENLVFPGLYEFCQLTAGGTVAAAKELNKEQSDICINWSGGMHHAKKASAYGFCYVNDVVLGILELLKSHKRVIYIDLDVHHGDAVEEAFYLTDRVLTVSFHKYGDNFFPNTGLVTDIGAEEGKYYTINVPLKCGIDDESYKNIFVPVITKAMETYRPNAIVVQCGADSISGDRFGCFNLTLRGHGSCVEFLKKYQLPLLMLGGGGYTLPNVARLWTYETAIASGVEIVNDIPYNDYFNCYRPDYKLHIEPACKPNKNSREYLQSLTEKIIENIRMLACAPGVQIQDIPTYDCPSDSDSDDDNNKDARFPLKKLLKTTVPEDARREKIQGKMGPGTRYYAGGKAMLINPSDLEEAGASASTNRSVHTNPSDPNEGGGKRKLSIYTINPRGRIKCDRSKITSNFSIVRDATVSKQAPKNKPRPILLTKRKLGETMESAGGGASSKYEITLISKTTRRNIDPDLYDLSAIFEEVERYRTNPSRPGRPKQQARKLKPRFEHDTVDSAAKQDKVITEDTLAPTILKKKMKIVTVSSTKEEFHNEAVRKIKGKKKPE